MTKPDFLQKLTAALTAQSHPRMPEKAYWNKPQSEESYFGPASAVTAHLWLLLRERNDWDNETEKNAIENVWEIHVLGFVTHVERLSPSEVTIDHLSRYSIKDGWNWYVTEEVTA